MNYYCQLCDTNIYKVVEQQRVWDVLAHRGISSSEISV